MDSESRCVDCKYFKADRFASIAECQDNTGICLRFPPSIRADDGKCLHPKVRGKYDRCFEFVPIEEIKTGD